MKGCADPKTCCRSLMYRLQN